ncbi:MAG TPA: GDSL-type esterase/lipase family protein [Vicinamibacterales bacterium]|jgi:lysophospholipase L1-like esterase
MVDRFLAFGDSMTEGTTSATFQSILTAGLAQSYPYKLQDRMRARYTAQTVFVMNGGRAGERATDGVARLPSVISEAAPNVLLLIEGVNDLNAFGGDGIGPAIGALETMVKFARARGISVFVATLPPQRPGGPKAFSEHLVGRFNNELKRMAPEEGATVIDINAGFTLDLIGEDGLHPTEAGYARVAEIVFDAMRVKFEQAAATRLEPPAVPGALGLVR